MKEERNGIMANRKGFQIARSMPPLPHKKFGQDFNIDKSLAVQWLVEQPEIKQTLFDLIREAGLIVYDTSTGLWKGIDCL